MRSQAEELAACKSKLAEVVDEVLYFESEVNTKNRHVKFLKQALADSTAAHGFVIESLNKLCAMQKRGVDPAMARKLQNTVNISMDDLRNFQQTLQRALVDSKLQLPAPAFVRSRVPLTLEDESMLQKLNQTDSSSKEPQRRRVNLMNGQNKEEALAFLEQEREEWKHQAKGFQKRIRDLEEELERARAAQVWPFKDDHRSFYDGFGMSSNTVDTSRQVNTIRDQADQRKDNTARDLSAEVDRLKRLLADQERDHEKQRKALMSQTEAELQDAESQIAQLRRELNDVQQQAHMKQRPSLPNKFRVNTVRINKLGEVDLGIDPNQEFERSDTEGYAWSPRSLSRPTSAGASARAGLDSMVPSTTTSPVTLSGSISVDQYNAIVKRTAQLEERVVQERNEKEKLKRQVDAAVREKQYATEALERLELEHGIGREEFETERGRHQALRDELEKAHRDREVISREYKAAERRHQAVMDEMKEVMEERDRALSAAQATNRKYLAGIQELEKAQLDLQAAIDEQAALELQREKLEKEKQSALRNLEAEKRNKDSLNQDLIILQQQKETIIMERDAAIKEQQNAMRRVDDAMRDRKAALESRDQAMTTIRELQDDLAQAKVKKHKDEQAIKSLQSALKETEAKLDEANITVAQSKQKLAEATALFERAKEDKISAEQEMEVAQRQCRALTEELRSVLRVRDIALQQRDAAIAQQRQLTDHEQPKPSLLEGGTSSSSTTSSPLAQHQQHSLLSQLESAKQRERQAQDKVKQLWEKVDELEVTLAALEEEKRELLHQLDRPSENNANSYDSGFFGASDDAIELHKQKLVALSQRIAEVHQTIRASCITGSSAVPSGEQPSSGDDGSLDRIRNSAVGVATKAQTLSDICFALSKQVQALEGDSNKASKVVHALIESARNASKLADRVKAENSVIASTNHEASQLREDLELAREANERLNEELHRAHSKVESLTVQLKQAELLQKQASEKVHFLQEKVNNNKQPSDVDEQQASHVECNHQIELLESKVQNLQLTIETNAKAGQDQIRKLKEEVVEERLQLKDALERLKSSDDKVLELKRKLRTNMFQVERLETERDRLASYVEDASTQLRGVANQKTNAAKELEEVYTSLTELEKQLLASRAENARLRQAIASHQGRRNSRDRAHSNTSTSRSALGSDLANGTAEDHIDGAPPRNVRIKRSGSILID